MLIHRIQKKDNLSNSEKVLADFILANILKVCNMSTREISSEAFVSSSTVIRFSKKMGCDSFEQFKRQLYAEWVSNDCKNTIIDADFPYTADMTYQEVFENITELEMKAIKETRELISLDKWDCLIEEIASCQCIDIYGEGVSFETADRFRSNMYRLGYDVFMEKDRTIQKHRSTKLFKDHFNLFLSYSGESQFSLSIAKMLQKNNLKSLSITSEKPNQLMNFTTYHLSIARLEGRITTGGLSTSCMSISFSFLLDVIFACLFQKNYKKNRGMIEKYLLLNNKYLSD